MYKILITDAHHRKALAAVRSLGKKGFYIIAGATNKVNMSRFSKYCDQFIQYPSPDKSPKEFLHFIINHLKSNKIDVILPMDDGTVEIFSQNKDRFNDLTRIPIPRYETFEVCRDKAKTLVKALDHNVPCPETYFIDNLEKLDTLKHSIKYPVIIKPRISSGSRGITYISTMDELLPKYQLVHNDYSYPMLQEFIPQHGKKYQVLLLINDKKEIKASCVQELVRQFPINGGPGTLYKTVHNPYLVEISSKFLQAIDWYGIACVEYITDPRDDEPKFMEINPRFWGTLNLSIQAGVDFPYLLTQLALNEEFDSVHNNNLDIYCQWLLPGDLLNFIFNKERNKEKIHYFFNKPNKFYYAILSKEDISSVFGALFSLILDTFNHEKLKNIFNRGK